MTEISDGVLGLQPNQASGWFEDMGLDHDMPTFENDMIMRPSIQTTLPFRNSGTQQSQYATVRHDNDNRASRRSGMDSSTPRLTDMVDVGGLCTSQQTNKKRKLTPPNHSAPRPIATQRQNYDRSGDRTPSQALSRLQREVDDFSERMLQQARTSSCSPEFRTLDRQNLSEALGVLLSAADRFVKLIPHICRPSTAPPTRSTSPAPLQSPWLNPHPRNSNMNHDSWRSIAGSGTRMLTPETTANIESQHALDGGTFHLMLVCHTRLLFAFEATLEAMLQRLLDQAKPEASAVPTDTISIGFYVVPNGTSLETLLYLQAISHQLERLGAAQRKHLPKRHQQGETGSSQSNVMQRIFCKQHRRAMSLKSVTDSALEDISEHERRLQVKLAELANLAEDSQNISSYMETQSPL